jgi:hypothetical protein
MGMLVLIQSCGGDDEDPVITDEGLYINELYASGDDWLELYNSGSASKDISGYRVYDDHTKKYTLPAGTVIPAKGYLVLFCDETSTGLHTSFKLSSDGEVISIENTTSVLIDRVDFPALNNGQSYARYPNGSGTFIVTGTTTQGVSNGETPTPVINDITKAPFIPGKSDNTKISAKVTHSAGISSVKLFYKFNEGAFTSITMTFVVNDIYEGTIPATGADGEVEFYIEAKSKSNELALSPENAPDKLHDYHINSDILPQLVINEFMAANTSCCPDKDGGVDEFDDWIEIYNKGAVAVNIADMYLSDDVLDPFKFHVPKTNTAKTTIQPGGHLVIWADESKSQGELHANFKLSANGESVGLYYVDGRTIDKYEYGQQNDNKSFGRITDGAATWKEFTSATPGTSNQ